MPLPKNIIPWEKKSVQATKRSGAVPRDLEGDKDSIRHGFTLLEILVVIAILGILVAIAIPALGHTRQKAQSAQCQSNLRSISTALNAYVADHNGTLIPAAVYAYNRNGGGWYSPDKREGGFWYTVLDPYVNPEIATSTDPNVYRNDKRDVWPLKTRAQHVKWQLCPGKHPKEWLLDDLSG